MTLSTIEKERYSRHLLINGFNEEKQVKLKSARVLVIGAGGLGCPVIQYLVAAGVGQIGIVDADVVSLSNLQRQILYTEEEIGHSKAEIAAVKMTIFRRAHTGEVNAVLCFPVIPLHIPQVMSQNGYIRAPVF